VLANILLYKIDRAIGVEISIDCELAHFIFTLTLDAVVPDIQVIKDNIMFLTVLHVNSSPSLVSTSHFKIIRHTLKIPTPSYLLAS
jgi:hypothetical protein